MNLSPELDQRLHTLLPIFLAENEKLNLSANRTEEACWVGNILDSLALLDALPSLSTFHSPVPPEPVERLSTLLDLGTGGGFPLLPVALARPAWSCTGLDAVRKKISALGRIADTLGLQNVQLVTGRSEEVGRDPQHREQYDIVTSRAVAPVRILVEYMSPFAKVGGTMVLWKSMQIEEELAEAKHAIDAMSCDLTRTYQYVLPAGFGERQLLIFRKKKATPSQYPRPVGMAKKKPL